MRFPLIFFLSLIISHSLFAQSDKKSAWEVYLQTKVVQNHGSNIYSQYGYEKITDFGLGGQWKKILNEWFECGLGMGFNYGSYSKERQKNSIDYFVDNFKNTEIQHFYIEKIDQFYLDLPVSMYYRMYNASNSGFSVFSAISPQLAIFSKADGLRFGDQKVVKTNVFESLNPLFGKDSPEEKHAFLNDMGLIMGISFLLKISEDASIVFDAGAEYSTSSKSFGSFVRAGARF